MESTEEGKPIHLKGEGTLIFIEEKENRLRTMK